VAHVNDSPHCDVPALLARGVAEIGRGALAEAESLLSAVLAAQPGHPIALYLQGVVAFERLQWPEAENRFRQALARAPGQPMVMLHLAQALREIFKRDKP